MVVIRLDLGAQNRDKPHGAPIAEQVSEEREQIVQRNGGKREHTQKSTEREMVMSQVRLDYELQKARRKMQDVRCRLNTGDKLFLAVQVQSGLVRLGP